MFNAAICTRLMNESVTGIKNLPYTTNPTSLFFKNYLFAEVTYPLIRFIRFKSFLGNTNNAARNGVNKQSTNTET